MKQEIGELIIRRRWQFGTRHIVVFTAAVASLCALGMFAYKTWLPFSNETIAKPNRVNATFVAPMITETIKHADDPTTLEASIALSRGDELRVYLTKRQVRSTRTGKVRPDIYHSEIWAEYRDRRATVRRRIWACGLEQMSKKPHDGFDYSDPYGFALFVGEPSKVGLVFIDDTAMLFAEIDPYASAISPNELKRVEYESLAPFIRKRYGSATGEFQCQVKQFYLAQRGWIVHIGLHEETFVLLRLGPDEWIEVDQDSE